MIDYKALFEATPSPFLILNPSFKIVAVNQAYLNVTGTKRDAILDRDLFEVFPANPDDLDNNGVSNLQASLEDVLKYRKPMTMAVQKYDIPVRDAEDGSFEERYWCSVNSPVFGPDNKVVLIVHNAQDVTNFVQAEQFGEEQSKISEELKVQSHHMEGEMYRSAQALQQANKQLQTANDAKSDFLTSMSHELRTPMNAILGFGQLIGLNSENNLTTSQILCVDHLLRGGQHLLGLIDDVLDLAKIEDGKTEIYMENISVKRIMDECMSLANALILEHPSVQLSNEAFLEGTEFVFADFTRTRQVVFNFLSNAIKYNRKGGKVVMNCDPGPIGMLRISVMDTGPGIAKDKQHELFEPFKRLGAETSSIEGTGIGLSISKKITELMNGHIGFESEQGKGSTFWVDLPLMDEKSIMPGHETNHDISAPQLLPEIKGSLLYVEDNRANTALMEMIVSSIKGLSLVTAPDAEMGIALAHQRKPDVIILDIHLPGIDGYEALKELKSKDDTAHIPVMALSAAASQQDIEKGIEAGFNEYLTKPIDIIKLTTAISNAMNH